MESLSWYTGDMYKADSALVAAQSEAASYGERRNGATPRLVVWHTTEGDSVGVTGNLRYDARRTDDVSATYFVGQDAEGLPQIGQGVPESMRPFTQARWNDEAISIEIIGRSAWDVDRWSTVKAGTLQALVALTADICARRGIPARWLTAQEILDGESGICDHRLCNEAAILEKPERRGVEPYTHTDVGASLRELSGALLDRVVALLTPPTPTLEEDTMQLVRPYGYDDIYVVGAGQPYHLTSPGGAQELVNKGLVTFEGKPVPKNTPYDAATMAFRDLQGFCDMTGFNPSAGQARPSER